MKEIAINTLGLLIVMYLLAFTVNMANEGFAGCRTVIVQPVGTAEALTLKRCYGKLSVVKEELDFSSLVEAQ